MGATLWFAITGQNPRFFRESEVPGALRPILSKALEKDREKRFQSAAELEQALSKLDPRARFVPQATAIDGLLPGCCPKCGHQHDLADKASAKRKFCESCGAALLEPCLKCGAENGVWAKFCGPCGADLNATLNAEIARLQSERDRAEVCHKSYQFPEALRALMLMAAVKHPRLKEFRDWAAELLPRVRSEFRPPSNSGTRPSRKPNRWRPCASTATFFPSSKTCPSRCGRLRWKNCTPCRGNCTRGPASCARKWRIRSRPRTTTRSNPRSWSCCRSTPTTWKCRSSCSRSRTREAKLREALWQTIRKHASVQNCQEYLTKYPGGPHVSQVQALLAPLFGDMLMTRNQDATLRRQYLAVRTPPQQQLDEKRARQGCQIINAISGAAAGAVLGALVGAAAGWIGGIIAGVIAGIALGIVLEQNA